MFDLIMLIYICPNQDISSSWLYLQAKSKVIRLLHPVFYLNYSIHFIRNRYSLYKYFSFCYFKFNSNVKYDESIEKIFIYLCDLPGKTSFSSVRNSAQESHYSFPPFFRTSIYAAFFLETQLF